MRTNLRGLAASLALLLLGSAGSPAQEPDADMRSGVVRQAVERVIRPGYDRLAATTATLIGAAKSACAAPSQAGLAEMRERYGSVVTAFAGVEFIRFGPIADDNRIERFLFWPDRRGVAIRQAQEILAREDPSALDPASLHAKSVAVQGLTALEAVLFGTGAETIGTGEGAYRCRYAEAIADNLATMAREVSAGWQAADGIAGRMMHPNATDARYRSVDDSLEEIFATASHGLEASRDIKLVPGIGKPGEEAHRNLFVFRRSGYALDALKANMAGLDALLNGSGLFTLLPDASRWAGPSVQLEFETIARSLGSLTPPVEAAAASSDGNATLQAVVLEIRGIESVLTSEVAPALGLSAGFSSLDGD